MKKIAAGRLPLNSNRKSLWSKTPFSPEFKSMISTFQRISAISDPIERRFELNRSAPDHRLPKTEFRKIFELFWEVQGDH
jgi:hypothetical protein